MRYSRILPGPRYLTSTAVVLSEAMKCVICIAVHLYNQYTNPTPSSTEAPLLSDDDFPEPHRYSLSQFYNELFSVKSGFPKLLIPAVLYTLQNNLQFVAASNLDAATFQVTYQCKILTTAVFAVLMLGQKLSMQKWGSLLILTAGVACVQIPSGSTPTTSAHGGSYAVGIMAVGIACGLSGLAGVYFEKVLKTGAATSIWVRNIQLSVGCLGIALMGTFVWDGQAISTTGFFQGYNPVVVATVCMQALGGLIVAMVIKYADNILKGFATSLSVILSTVASVFLFDFVVTIYFLMGACLVFAATYLYGLPEKKKDLATEESKPMLVVEDYDEKMAFERDGMEEDLNEKDLEGQGRYRDEESERRSSSSAREPVSSYRGIIYEELGHVA